MLRLGAFNSRRLAWAVIATTFLSIIVAAGQAGNENSPFYIYDVTNRGFGVGFFANANHQATLMVSAIAFLAALLMSRRTRSQSRGQSGRGVAFAAGFAVLAVGLALNGSLAGVGLAIPVAAASLLLSAKVRRRIKPVAALAGIGAISIAAVAVIMLGPLGNNLTAPIAGTEAESRQTSITMTAKAGVDHLPLGSGLGSFATVYRTYEDPAEVGGVYMNHAHSDFTELFLELGAPGLLLTILFLGWWLIRTVTIWRQGNDVFACAASIASGAILAHSVVDYPLRTVAIGAVFAACCALMAEPRELGRRVQENETDRPRHLTA
jgi:O-antigen ligase